MPRLVAVGQPIAGGAGRRLGEDLGRIVGLVPVVIPDQDARLDAVAVPVRRHALELLDLVGLADRAKVRARNFAYGDQRRLEIARALALQFGSMDAIIAAPEDVLASAQRIASS